MYEGVCDKDIQSHSGYRRIYLLTLKLVVLQSQFDTFVVTEKRSKSKLTQHMFRNKI